jgi:hypothetical protein
MIKTNKDDMMLVDGFSIVSGVKISEGNHEVSRQDLGLEAEVVGIVISVRASSWRRGQSSVLTTFMTRRDATDLRDALTRALHEWGSIQSPDDVQ